MAPQFCDNNRRTNETLGEAFVVVTVAAAGAAAADTLAVVVGVGGPCHSSPTRACFVSSAGQRSCCDFHETGLGPREFHRTWNHPENVTSSQNTQVLPDVTAFIDWLLRSNGSGKHGANVI